jgi:hypothetical protein
MKYLIFKKIPYEYGAEYDRVRIGVMNVGIGAYEDKDADLLMKLHGDLIDETNEEEYVAVKKTRPVSLRVLGTVHQDPSKDPNAVYAEESKPAAASKKKAKDLVKVGKAKVEDPLEESK